MLKLYSEIINKKANQDNGCIIKVHLKVKSLVYFTPFPTDKQLAKEVEYYKLHASKDLISLEMNYLNALVRGLETLSQLVIPFNSQLNQIINTPLTIEDFPKYPLRGVMIDTSRHFININVLKQVIDGLMYSKLNTLHLHLTDDDNFAFESKDIPDISKDNLFYTQKQLQDLILYAKIRSVQLIPEIDNPGHTRSWGKNINNITIINPDVLECGYLIPSENATYNVTSIVLNDVVKTFKTQINPKSELYDYIHLGGDEIEYNLWLKNENILKFMKEKGFKNEYQLLNYYFNRVRASIPNNTYYLYWTDSDFFSKEEYRNQDIFKQNNTILHYWGKYNILANSTVSNKTKMVLSPNDYTYLDCGTGNTYGDNSWCDPFITWKKIYKFDPDLYRNNFDVLGSIACLWTGLVDDDIIIQKIFPRSTSLSERLWHDFENKAIDIKYAFRRMIKMVKRLKDRGIKATPITNLMCSETPDDCIKFIN